MNDLLETKFADDLLAVFLDVINYTTYTTFYNSIYMSLRLYKTLIRQSDFPKNFPWCK